MPRKDHGENTRKRYEGRGMTFAERRMGEFFAADNFLTPTSIRRVGEQAMNEIVENNPSFLSDTSPDKEFRKNRSA